MSIALVDKNLKEIINKKIINSKFNLINYVQPASIDIPIENKIYLIKQKFLPFNSKIKDTLKNQVIKEIDLDKDNEILFKNQTYLVKCLDIDLPKNYFIKVSPKSSIGRVDVLVRAIFDNSGLYYFAPSGYKGELWIEITPQSFNIKIKKALSLTQLMVFENTLSNIDISKEKLLYDNNHKVIRQNIFENNKLILSLNVNNKIFGYEAKKTNEVVDLTKTKFYNWKLFFKEIKPTRIKGKLQYLLEKDKFYILSTKEKVSVPIGFSAEMVPFTHLVGELRVHYAGFFDPGFGYGQKGEIKGNNGTLEIRPHENILVFDGQPICLIEFFKNKEQPINYYGSLGNNYQVQNKPKLAKFFK